MAIQSITYGTKVDLNTTSVADINKVKASDLNEIKSVVNNNGTELSNFEDRLGKTLWEGSFTSGTLSVPGISEYKLLGVYSGNLIMIGNQYYGGSSFRTYQALTISAYAYRYTYNATNETLTTDGNNGGATNGTANIAITKIVGLI